MYLEQITIFAIAIYYTYNKFHYINSPHSPIFKETN